MTNFSPEDLEEIMKRPAMREANPELAGSSNQGRITVHGLGDAGSSPAPAANREAFTYQVLKLARILGWRRAHFRPALTAKGWRTAVSGDGSGFPDIVLAKAGFPIVFAEIKGAKGSLSPEQRVWRDVLLACPGCRYFVWRPADLDTISEILTKR